MEGVDLIREVRVEATTTGVNETLSAVKGLGAGLDGLAVKQDNLSAAQLRVNRQLENTARRYAAEYRAVQELSQAQALLNRARAQGLGSTEAFARVQDGVTLRLSKQAAAMIEASQAAQKLSAAQARAATEAGQKLGSLSYSRGSFANDQEIAKTRAALLPLAAAQQQYEAALQKANAAAKIGALTEKERTAVVARASATLLNQTNAIRQAEEANSRLTKGVGLNAYAWQNLGFQVNDVVTSLASGISPFQTLAQQGGQIYQILQSGEGGVGGALAAIKERLLAISPLTGVFGVLAVGVVALGAAALRYVEQQHELEVATLGVGRAAGLTAGQIEKIAEAYAEAGDLSIAQAKEVAAAFVASGKLQAEALGPGIKVIKDYAAATRQEIPDAAKDLATELGRLANGGLQAVQEKTGAFDVESQNLIRTLLEEGRATEALRAAIAALDRGLDDSGQKAERYGGVWSSITRALSNAATAAGRLAQDVTFPDQAGIQRNLERQIRSRRATGLDTSGIEMQLAEVRRGIAEAERLATESGQKVKQNIQANASAAVRAVLPQVESYERIIKLRDEANRTLNAREAQGDTDSQEYRNARTALEALTKARRDYEFAAEQGGLDAYKRATQIHAETEATKAKTPADRANAAALKETADLIGVILPKQERYQRINEASNKVLREARQASDDASRTTNEQTAAQNALADATAKTTTSTALLAAQKKIDAEVNAGRVDEVDRERKVQEELQNQISALNKQAAERVRASRDQAAVQESLNAKVADGNMGSAEAQRRQAVLIEQARLQREADAASGEEKERLQERIRELGAAQEAQISAEDRSRVLGMIEAERDRIAVLQREIELRGENVVVRNRELAILQATQALERQSKGLSTTPEGRKLIDTVALRSETETVRQEAERLAQEMSSVFAGIFDDMFKAGNKGLDGFFDSFSRGFARIGTRLIEQNLIAPLFGGQGGVAGGANPLDALGKLFDFDGIKKAVETGSFSGIFSGVTELGKPQGGGGISSSFLGKALLPAGAGAAIGYQSQSPLMGAVGGGLAGFATAGPIGAIIGAGAGLLGGLFGQDQAKQERKRQIREQAKQDAETYQNALGQITIMRQGFRGEATTGIEATIRASVDQMRQAAVTAGKGGDKAGADAIVREFEGWMLRLRTGFMRAFEGTLGDLGAGQGTSGPFAQAAAAVGQLGEALKAFVADAQVLPDAERNAARARTAAVNAALDSIDAPKALSDTASELARIRGTAAGLQQVLVDLGASAEEAAVAIRDRTAAALDALRQSFDQDVGAKLNEATGKGYLNEIGDLVKEAYALGADAIAVGGNRDQVTAYFSAAAQGIVNEAELTGAAFDDLMARFPDLTGLVHQYSTALADSAAAAEAARQAEEALARRRESYQDRAFTAGLDTNTEAGALAAFDRAAQREREEEARTGSGAIADLEQALAAERLGIVRDFAARAADATRQAAEEQARIAEEAARRRLSYADRLFAAGNDNSTLEGQLAALDRAAMREREEEMRSGGQALADLEAAQLAERLRLVRDFNESAAESERQRVEAGRQAYEQFSRSIREFVDGLRAGSGSPLAPKDRLSAAQSQFDAQLALARKGDRDALSGITGYASNLIDASKAYNASNPAFQATFESVAKQLEALPKQVSAEQFIVDAINASKGAIVDATTLMRSELSAGLRANSPGLVAAALNANFALLDTSLNGLLDFSEFKAGLGPLATAAEQQAARAIFNAIDLNGDGQIDKLELLRARAAATEANTGQTKGAIDASNAIATGQTAIIAAQRDLLSAVAYWTNATTAQVAGTTANTNVANATLGQIAQLNANYNASFSNHLDKMNMLIAKADYLNYLNEIHANNLRFANERSGARVFASGGWVNGPGTGTSDSISARLSNGEFVVNAASARMNASLLEGINAGRMTMPALPVAMPFGASNDNGALLAATERQNELLAEQVALLKRQIETTAAGARHVGEKVEGNTAEVKRGNSDTRQAGNRPRAHGKAAA